jgi:hypothetical protein
MKGEALSRELRTGSSPSLRRRRGVIGLSLVSAGSMALVTLYQTGLIKHLPEPPLPGFDADRVDASDEAYRLLSMPDGVLGLASYSATLALAAMDGPDRARERPWLPVLLLGKVGLDALAAGKLTVDQWKDHRAFCFWCLLAAASTFASLPLAVPEACEAARRLRRAA